VARGDLLSFGPWLDCWKQQLMSVEGIVTELRLELQEIEDASRSLGRLHRLSGEVKARAQSLPKSGALRNRATPRDAKGLPDEIGLAEMRGMASNALARRAGRLCAPDSIISCPVLRGHVHLALRFL
jgi:hypothetical protein